MGRKTLRRYLFSRRRRNEQTAAFFFLLALSRRLSLRISYSGPRVNLTDRSVRNFFRYKQQNIQLAMNWTINIFNLVKVESGACVSYKLSRTLTLVYVCPAILNLLNFSVLRPLPLGHVSINVHGRRKACNSFLSGRQVIPAGTPSTLPLMFHWSGLAPRSHP